MKTPIERAVEAQVAFAGMILSPRKTRDGVSKTLAAVVATAELAVWDAHGITAQRGHGWLHEREPAKWAGLEEAVFGALHQGHTLGGVYPIVADFVREHANFPLLSINEVADLVHEMRRDAA